jgi:hypothetical protein
MAVLVPCYSRSPAVDTIPAYVAALRVHVNYVVAQLRLQS